MQKYSLLRLALLVTFALAVMVSVATWCFLATPFGNARASGLDSTASNVSLDVGVAESPVPGGPGFYSLSAFEFTAEESYCCVSFQGPDLYNSSSAEFFPYAAPVNLPNGATVTKFVLYFWDSSSVKDLGASLYRVPLDGSSVEKMAEAFSAGSPGYDSSASTLIDFPVIDQQAYAYYVEVPLPQGSDIRLRGIRIDYGYGLSLPLVSREN